MANRFSKVLRMVGLGAALAGCGSTVELNEEAARAGEKDVDVQAALARFKDVRVLGRDQGQPYAVAGRLGQLPAVDAVGELRARDELRRTVMDLAPVFRVSGEDLVHRRTFVDALGHQHLRFQQTLQGKRVVGGELILHADGAGNVYAMNGTARAGESVPAPARVAPEAAAHAAVRASDARGALAQGTPELLYVLSARSPQPRLAFEVRVRGERQGIPVHDLVYVDAQHGDVLRVNPRIHTALHRKLYSANNGTSTPGTLKRQEGQGATGDTHVDTNYARLGETYNCYKTLFNRDSFDDAGATLVSTVHYDVDYVNAYWDGTQMVYGDGDGVDSTMLGLDADVTTHELTHAVTERESDLIYSEESGGLNESMSDIFAGVCESWASGTWSVAPDIFKIGEDVWTPGTSGDALRYMDDPAQDGQSLDFYPDYASGVDVHYSSGISNLVFSLLAKGGAHPRGKTENVVPAIGPLKAGRIFYKANTEYFTASTTFEQAKTYTVQAADVLFGAGSAESLAVVEAWKAVGLPVPPPVLVPLTNGVAVTGLSAKAGSRKYFTLTVPAGQGQLVIDMGGGGSGIDPDLYVKRDGLPTVDAYDCRPYKYGSAESCTFANPVAGTYYVMIDAYTAYSGLTLKGTYSGVGSGGTPVSTTVTGSLARNGKAQYGAYSVKAGTQFKVVMSGTGDPDLYVRFGAAPTLSTSHCRPYVVGGDETCDITVPAGQSSAYIMVHGYTATTYTLNIDYLKP